MSTACPGYRPRWQGLLRRSGTVADQAHHPRQECSSRLTPLNRCKTRRKGSWIAIWQQDSYRLTSASHSDVTRRLGLGIRLGQRWDRVQAADSPIIKRRGNGMLGEPSLSRRRFRDPLGCSADANRHRDPWRCPHYPCLILCWRGWPEAMPSISSGSSCGRR